MSIAADAIAAYLADNRDRLAELDEDELYDLLDCHIYMPSGADDLVKAGAIIVILLERNGV